MKLRLMLLGILAFGMAGCRSPHLSHNDEFENVKVDEMRNNFVSKKPFTHTLVCLNARRETRTVTVLTNQVVQLLTNVSLSYVTNLAVTISTNIQVAFATNAVAATAPAEVVTNGNADSVTNSAPTPVLQPTTNVTVTTAQNVSTTRAGGQTALVVSAQSQRSRQITSPQGSIAISVAENENATVETNMVVTVITNVTVTAITNLTVTLTNLPIHDYFLVVEYTPPPDFNLQQGESLILLVDGVRHVPAQATCQTVVVPRRGFAVATYRATPQLLVDIANARKVKLRLKGTNAVIEREVSPSSRANFRKFLLEYLAADSAPDNSAAQENPPNS